MRRAFVLLLGAIFLLGWSTSFPIAMQAQKEEVFVIQDGSNACQYLVVKRFFECVELWRYWHDQDERLAKPLLRMAHAMGIIRDSEAWDILLDSSRRAKKIMDRRAPSTPQELEQLGHGGFKSAQLQVVRVKAESLAKLYSRFLRDMERSGVDPGVIEDYLELRIRPTVKLVSNQPLDHPDNQALIDTMLAFDEAGR